MSPTKTKDQKPLQELSFAVHLFNNLSLTFLSLLFLPITTIVVSVCYSNGYFFPAPSIPSCTSAPPKTVLVSSLAMTKGLSLARAFYLAGNRVIGLDFERAHIPSSGRFSKALSQHYEIPMPVTDKQKKDYIKLLIDIIRKERVDLWVCVSGVETTIEDAIAKYEIEKETSCKVFQLEPDTCKILHEKNLFIEKTAEIGLGTPETKMVKSHEEAFRFLAGKSSGRYILKSVWLDDVSRADMTLYPRPTPEETIVLISGLEITTDKPWVFQEFVEGDEYCTHGVVVKGHITAFVACPSSELLMHYQGLPADSKLSQMLLEFTEKYAKGLEGGNVTGQLSFDLIARKSKDDGGLQLYPIECNPRAHTTVILFNNIAGELADSYLTLLDSPRISTKEVCIPDALTTDSFYWIGHDIVSLLLLPLLQMSDGVKLLSSLKDFALHVLFWKDATFELWDPLPFWFLYHVYWPGLFIWSLVTGRKWSRINMSTTRIFGCN